VQRAVKATAAGADRVLPPPRGLVVLIYHRVGRRSSMEVDLPVELFDAQLATLRAMVPVVSLDDGLLALTEQPAPERSQVAVTFDDGTADFVDVVVPLLVRHGIPATLYLATDFVETGTEFPRGGTPVSWQGLRDALSTGLVTVGSHTHHHALLDRLPAPAIAEELDASIELIRDRLGVDPAHFAYPKAVPGSPAADAAVRARFRSAAIAGTRANPYGRTDLYRLARSPVQLGDGMRWFGRKVAGGMTLEDRLRRLANRGRYAGTTT
jgi:peptidoglycan/xylan/chitin deacetylase (PgdA/CDA1 family)